MNETRRYQHQDISGLAEGMACNSVYLLQVITPRITTTGKPYLAVTLQDATGSISGKVWEKKPEMDALVAGEAVHAGFTVETYNGKLQINVNLLQRIPDDHPIPDEYLRLLLPMAPEPLENMFSELWNTVDGFHDSDYKRLTEKVLSDNREVLLRIPAAQKVHENGIGGLLQHLTGMLRVAKGFVAAYPTLINAELLYCGVILHDIGKIREFQRSKFGLVSGYTNEGNLEGHLFIGAEYIGKVCDDLSVDPEKKMLLQHMLLSHHGNPEFGACVQPKFLEAYLLYLCDLTDSRVWIFEDAYKDLKPGETAETANFFLDNVRVYRPKE